MPTILYNNPAADHITIRIRRVNDNQPLAHAGIYEVDDETAAALLAQPEWAEATDREIADMLEPVINWGSIPGIGAEIGQALEIGLGITSRAQLRAEVAEHGTDRIIQVPGIGAARARTLIDYANEE
jgi:hypothetical protein